MTAIKNRMPRDVAQRAKAVVVAIDALMDGDDSAGAETGKDPERVARGKLGGAKGGAIRAAKLSPERRREIASQAARARWRSREDE
jgi:hypothetical protein